MNNIALQLDMVLRGVGLGFFPCMMGDCEESLVRLTEPEASFDVWLLSHQDTRHAARMRAFRQYIIRHIPELSAKIAGEIVNEVNISE